VLVRRVSFFTALAATGAALVLGTAVAPPSASAFDLGRETANFAKIGERPRLEPAAHPLSAPSRPVRFVNRNGALLSAHLWLPPASVRLEGRLPTVVFVSGDLAPETFYWFAAAAFARAGYLVLTFDPQGHGLSDTFGTGADYSRHVAVQQAAESGTVEAAADEDAVEQTQDALAFLLSTRAKPYLPPAPDGTPATPGRAVTPGQRRQQAEVASGKAARANPLYARVDAGRIGLVGHSRGADAVSILAARDHRIRAGIAWDDLLAQTSETPPVPLRPRVPVLGIADDYYQTPTPFLEAPDPAGHSAGFDAARAAGVDSAELVLRGATHYEFSYAAGVPLPATLRGVDFATWYATAWLDRYVKGDGRATSRILTGRWRADAAEAKVDPTGDGNLFSFYYRSQLAVHRPSTLVGHGRRRHLKAGRLVTCADLRGGCAALLPAATDTGPVRYQILTPEP
jgi:dienelactone hydrolase